MLKIDCEARMNRTRCNLKMLRGFRRGLLAGALALAVGTGARAQTSSSEATTNAGTPVALTLKRAIELAIQNSKDIQVAKLEATLADRSAMITKAQFLPNLYAGS